MDKLEKSFKTGADLDCPFLLWDENVETGERVAVSLVDENLQVDCSIFDHKTQKIATATVALSQNPETPNLFIIQVPSSVTRTWLPCENAKFDIKATNSITGKVMYSRTIYFEIERGLS